eukprot:6163387-Ditylum_brightwellii.AAC.1
MAYCNGVAAAIAQVGSARWRHITCHPYTAKSSEENAKHFPLQKQKVFVASPIQKHCNNILLSSLL